MVPPRFSKRHTVAVRAISADGYSADARDEISATRLRRASYYLWTLIGCRAARATLRSRSAATRECAAISVGDFTSAPERRTSRRAAGGARRTQRTLPRRKPCIGVTLERRSRVRQREAPLHR